MQFEPGIYVDVVSGERPSAPSEKIEPGCWWPSFTKLIVSANIIELQDVSRVVDRSDSGGERLSAGIHRAPTISSSDLGFRVSRRSLPE